MKQSVNLSMNVQQIHIGFRLLFMPKILIKLCDYWIMLLFIENQNLMKSLKFMGLK